MRPVRTSIAALILAAFFMSPTPGAASSEQAHELARIEKRGLTAAGSKRLRELLTRPQAPQAQTVEFSRKWVDAQPKPKKTGEWQCLAEALYFEARGETVKGQFAVRLGVINRLAVRCFCQRFMVWLFVAPGEWQFAEEDVLVDEGEGCAPEAA